MNQNKHEHNHEHDHHHENHHDHHDHQCSHDHVQHETFDRSTLPAQSEKAVFYIQQMDCPTEENLIRAQLQPMKGVVGLQFNLIERELTVHHQLNTISPIINKLDSLDMQPKTKSDSLSTQELDEHIDTDFGVSKKKWWLLGIAGIFALSAEIMALIMHDDKNVIVMGFAVIAILLGGLTTLKKGWIALKHMSLNMNFLMSIAVIGAAAIGQWPEAAMVIVLFTLSEMIESLSLNKARDAIQHLLDLTPDEATIKNPNKPSEWQTIPATQVPLNSIVRIRPGERIPLDGIVTEGESSINQAPITGESLPVFKQVGDTLYAGTINEDGLLQYRVTAVQAESTLSRIIKNVQEAQADRAPTQRFVDQFAKYYIPIVVLLAFLIAIIPPLFLQAHWDEWLYRALVLLVIACPCALVISTPITIVSGLATAARRGILIKGGSYLELGRKLNAIAVDKTGTITHGEPEVTHVLSLTHNDHIDEHLAYAASLAQQSNHPVSKAVAEYWMNQQEQPLLSVTDFTAITGKGTKGNINGDTYHLGNHRLIHELGQCSPTLENTLEGIEKQGNTAVILCKNHQPLCIFAVADTIRSSSKEAIEQLKQRGLEVFLLTGDNQHTANAIAKEAGIQQVFGDCLPEDKLHKIEALCREQKTVGMVGDGINDAPALAKAHIGFAMGAAGSDTAIETADIALMNDDLMKLPEFIDLSKRTYRTLVQNITIALGIKIVFLLLAIFGESTLWMAVFADIGASLIVIFNGLRLLKKS